MTIVDELVAILGFDLQGEGDLDRFNRGLDRAEQNAKRAAGGINAMSVAVGTFIGNFASRAVSAIGEKIGSLPGDILEVGREFEDMTTVLETIEGSSSKAKESMAWVQEFAKTTPYDLAQVSQAFVRMRAYGLDPTTGLLKRTGDAAAAMGKTLMDGVEAIADAVTGQNERLKAFGITASVAGDKVTYSWNENGKTMTKTVRKNGEEIIGALTEIFGRFDGAMDTLAKKQHGILGNIADTWTGFLKQIADKGYYDDVTRRLQGVLDLMGEWDRDGTLDRVAQNVSDFLVGSMNVAGHLGSQFWAIGKGAYNAANGLTELISRVTGLNKTASAGVLGAAVLGSSKMGRGLLLALASRIPQIAALLLIDDLATGLAGGDSYIGKLAGGQEALDKLRESMGALKAAAEEALSGLTGVAGFKFPDDWGGAIDTTYVDGLEGTAKAVRNIAASIEYLSKVIKEGDAGAVWDWLVNGKITKPKEPNTGDVIKSWLTGEPTQRQTDNENRKYEDRTRLERSDAAAEANRGAGFPTIKMEQPSSNLAELLRRGLANAEKVGAAGGSVVNDNRLTTDARSFPMTTSVTVNQTVTSATSAPGAAARATGSAVANAVTGQKSRIASMPTTSGNGPQ